MSLGLPEIVLILVVILVLFGGKKLPELARGLGKAQAEYNKAKEAIEEETEKLKKEVKKSAAEKKTAAKKTVAKTKKTPAKKTVTEKTVKKIG